MYKKNEKLKFSFFFLFYLFSIENYRDDVKVIIYLFIMDNCSLIIVINKKVIAKELNN